MPLSEFYRLARGRLESSQQKTITCSTGPSHVTAKDIGNASNSKEGKLGLMDSDLNEFAATVPPQEMGLDQDGEMVPWLNHPIHDSLQHNYCSGLLPELSSVTVNELSAQHNFARIDKTNQSSETIKGSRGDSNGLSLEQANATMVSSSEIGESSKSRSCLLYPCSIQENESSLPSLRSGVVSSIIRNDSSNTKHAVYGNHIQAQTPAPAGGGPGTKIQKKDLGVPNNKSGIINFSHFSRSAALVRANFQSDGALAISGALAVPVEGSRAKGKGNTLSYSNLPDPTLNNKCNGLRNELGYHNHPNLVQSKVDLEKVVAKPLEDLHAAEQSEAVCQEDALNNEKLPNQALSSTPTKGVPDSDKPVEPVVASSSVCSANSAEGVSSDPTHNLKRKRLDNDDDFEGQSEDVEEESVGIKKTTPAQGGTGSKRSRAAEVHNLSERRRRDRINEKMRALQELIPNCNKVDKASMLDEAIEYLKTLQLQVQIMSMGAGLYMPSMLLPTGMQHVHAAHMAHYPPMGVGMGMGFGMGMLDVNGGSPRCPIIQMPHMPGSHFPSPHLPAISGPNSFQGMPGPNFHGFGHPSQGLPMSGPPAPLTHFLGGPPINAAVGLYTSGMAAPLDVPCSAPSTNLKDLTQNTNSQMMQNTNASSSRNQTSIQCQATNEAFEQPLVFNNDKTPEVGSSEDVS